MGFWTFVFAISVVSIAAGVINTWIKARHGYPIAEENCGRRKTIAPQYDALRQENHELKQRLAEVTERLAVLERIATDPAERVSREIESLR
jgi:flagellar motility protein MotE (MotC chaperone)